jgi:hypothetical protein
VCAVGPNDVVRRSLRAVSRRPEKLFRHGNAVPSAR